MLTQVHGHEVIALMMTATQPYTRDSLAAAILDRFGPDARFFTCSAEGMTPPNSSAFSKRAGNSCPRPAVSPSIPRASASTSRHPDASQFLAATARIMGRDACPRRPLSLRSDSLARGAGALAGN